MAPTPRALELEEGLDQVMRQLAFILSRDEFDPAHAQTEFELIAPDYISSQMIPNLMARLEQLAPHVSLSISALNEQKEEKLRNGSAHLLLSAMEGEVPAGFYRQPLFDEGFVCLMRSCHPQAGQPLTLERYADLSHILVRITGRGSSPLDRYLSSKGLSRRIGLKVPYFMAAPAVVAKSDLVFTLPRRMAASLRDDRLIVRELPEDAPTFTFCQFWHERMHKDPAQQWLRRVIKSICPDG